MSLVKTNKNGFPSLMSDFFDADKFFSPRWLEKEFESSFPAVNIKESDKDFSIELAIPGMKKEDFKIDVDENILTISAEKKEEKEEEKKHYTRKEFSYNSFSRSFTLPATANGEKIDAKYQDGILKLSVAKKEEAKVQPKKEIKVS